MVNGCWANRGVFLIRFPRLRARAKPKERLTHSVRDYRAMVADKLKSLPDDPGLALARAIGAETMEIFASQGDGHVAVLRHHGLIDGMNVYDLGCGCGRTAQALYRQGWQGGYLGAGVVQELLDELALRCPVMKPVSTSYRQSLRPTRRLTWFSIGRSSPISIRPNAISTRDAFRALKPGGKMIFPSSNWRNRRMIGSGMPI